MPPIDIMDMERILKYEEVVNEDARLNLIIRSNKIGADEPIILSPI